MGASQVKSKSTGSLESFHQSPAKNFSFADDVRAGAFSPDDGFAATAASWKSSRSSSKGFARTTGGFARTADEWGMGEDSLVGSKRALSFCETPEKQAMASTFTSQTKGAAKAAALLDAKPKKKPKGKGSQPAQAPEPKTWTCGICGHKDNEEDIFECPTCYRPRGLSLNRSYMTAKELTQSVVDALNGDTADGGEAQRGGVVQLKTTQNKKKNGFDRYADATGESFSRRLQGSAAGQWRDLTEDKQMRKTTPAAFKSGAMKQDLLADAMGDFQGGADDAARRRAFISTDGFRKSLPSSVSVPPVPTVPSALGAERPAPHLGPAQGIAGPPIPSRRKDTGNVMATEELRRAAATVVADVAGQQRDKGGQDDVPLWMPPAAERRLAERKAVAYPSRRETAAAAASATPAARPDPAPKPKQMMRHASAPSVGLREEQAAPTGSRYEGSGAPLATELVRQMRNNRNCLPMQRPRFEGRAGSTTLRAGGSCALEASTDITAMLQEQMQQLNRAKSRLSA
eukprot:TRINITY_DN35652_c0_g1_i1.p1 TRINITY_DN35652_c0_g1~~TRINITY_DN35652_c0_g1_i1.p1  ORF type:complete len:515 (-),score=114.39 TRINITY_DN35652_c0_g1_i1:399-1943(-)